MESLKLKLRRRTLKKETQDGVSVWTWSELDGSTSRSVSDPRKDWDASSGGSDVSSSDGGGDFGGGGGE